MSVPDEKGNPPLWLALENNLEDIASTLVRLSVGFSLTFVLLASNKRLHQQKQTQCMKRTD